MLRKLPSSWMAAGSQFYLWRCRKGPLLMHGLRCRASLRFRHLEHFQVLFCFYLMRPLLTTPTTTSKSHSKRKMGKNTDKLYITHSEWSSADAFSASHGAGAGSRAQRPQGANFKRLPFNFCAASLQPFKNPVCTPEGTIFDVEVIGAWLEKNKTNPVNGEPLDAKDLIKLNFARNADAEINLNAGPTDGKGDMSASPIGMSFSCRRLLGREK